MKKDLDKKENFIEKEDLLPHQDGGSGSGKANKGEVSKDNTKLIATLFLLFAIILMAIVHAHFGAIIVTGITLGVLIYSLNKKE